jgi:multiple sugar transport system permease protein
MSQPRPEAGGRAVARRGPSSVPHTVGVVVLLVFALFPIAWTCYTSFRPERDIITDPTSFIPSHLTLANYARTWQQTDFPRLMLNSLVVSAMTVVISLALATFAAFSLSRSDFRGRGAVMMLYLGVRIIPGVLLLIPLFIVMQQLGLLDTRFALALTYTTFALPAAVWFLKGFFDALPVDLENAARVDGCSRLGALFRVVLPLVRPGLAATGILVAIEAWNDILFALLLTSTTKSRTWPVGMKLLIGEFQLPWGQLTAAAVLSLLPVVIAFAFAGRAMIAGLTAGGLKD